MTDFKTLLGSRLKAVRKAANFKSAKEFAEKHNIPATTYGQHEAGKRAIGVETLLHYCDALRVDPIWLLFGGKKPYITEATQSSLLTVTEDAAGQLPTPPGQFQMLDTDAVATVDVKLYNKVIVAVFNTKEILEISPMELIDFSMHVYNNVVATSADEAAKDNMIKLSVSSLIRGYSKKRQKYHMKISEL